MDLETIIQSEVNQKEKNKYPILILYVESEKNWYRQYYLQCRNRDTDRRQTYQHQGGNGCGRINWETGLDIYTLLILCIK